jgi:V-type H+-transporting ATPase subunit a
MRRLAPLFIIEGTTPYARSIGLRWYFTDNELVPLNSYKVKAAIVVRMAQMFFGLILNFISRVKRRYWPGIVVVLVPEVIYVLRYFGYLVYIIVCKWLTVFPPERERGVDLIQLMINMSLKVRSE